MDNTALGNRMKEYYEKRARTFLTRRIPVIMRVDMKAGGTYTRGLKKPFDIGYVDAMNAMAIHLVSNIQGAKCAFVQSDEVSVLITDYDKLTTDAWFDYSVQKMCSVGASMAANGFNRHMMISEMSGLESSGFEIRGEGFRDSFKFADFDCRVFNIPKEEANNCFVWRQQDTVRNSISMVAQANFSHNVLHKKNVNMMQEMLFTQKNINWNDLDSHLKQGRFIVRQQYVNGINTTDRGKNGQRILEFFGDTNKWATYNYEVADWVDIEKPTIRNRWEVVPTTPDFSKKPEIINKFVS